MGKVKLFSDKEIEFIRLHKFDMTDVEIAKYLNRHPNTIRQKRAKLGIYKKRYVIWDNSKISYLTENFPCKNTDDIAIALGVNEKTVREKAKELGLKKSSLYSKEEDEYIKKNYCNMSARELSANLNILFHNKETVRTKSSVYQRATQKLGLEAKPHKVGDEVFWKGRGHVYIKIKNEPYAGHKNYIRKSNLEYEKNSGTIDDGFKIIHLDGNPFNFESANMALVNDSIIGTYAGTLKGISKPNNDIKKVVWKISQLEYEIKKENTDGEE